MKRQIAIWTLCLLLVATLAYAGIFDIFSSQGQKQLENLKFGPCSSVSDVYSDWVRYGPNKCVNRASQDGANGLTNGVCTAINLATHGVPTTAKMVWVNTTYTVVTGGTAGQYSASIDFFYDSSCTVDNTHTIPPRYSTDHHSGGTFEGFADATAGKIYFMSSMLPIYINGQTTIYATLANYVCDPTLVCAYSITGALMYED